MSATTGIRQRVTGIVRRDNMLLMIHRFRHGDEYWVLLGGGVEEGETWEDALTREILEETGLKLLSFEFMFESKEDPGCIFYTCELEAGEPCLGGPELAEQTPDNLHILEWVEIENIASLPKLYPRLNTDVLA